MTMPSCRAIQEDLTAWIDGELPPRPDARVQRHLATCARCAAEAQRVRAAIATHTHMLTAMTAVDDVVSGALWNRLHAAMQQEPEPISTWSRVRGWLLQPLPLAGATVAAAAVLILLIAGGPAAVLIPLGVEAPPLAVKANPDLFRNYPLIQHLDVLENFDTVESIPLDDDQSPQKG